MCIRDRGGNVTPENPAEPVGIEAVPEMKIKEDVKMDAQNILQPSNPGERFNTFRDYFNTITESGICLLYTSPQCEKYRNELF